MFQTLYSSRFCTRTIFLGIVLSFAVVFTANAHHTDSPEPCYDITDAGTAVLFNGVPNAGVLNFDPAPGPSHDYEACVHDTLNDGAGTFEVKGWAWDDNLGWVSMYCADENGDGAPYENLGLSCGNVLYGVTMEGSDQTNPGMLHGYAWGDNTGWISFNCADTGTCPTGTTPPDPSVYKIQAETVDVACLGEVDQAGCPNNGPESSHAWSDNVGWFDLSGIKFPWVELISAAVNVTYEITPDPATVNKLTAPVADGSDGYTMKVHMTKLDGTPIDPSLYNITVEALWTQDTVNVDQTDAGSVDCEATPADPSCAVMKPYDLTTPGWTAYGGGTSADAYEFKVTSLAPTSGMNGYDKDEDGSVNYSYELFVLGNPIAPSSVPQNRLILSEVKASVQKISNGLCAFGEFGCATKLVSTGSQNLEFTPAIELNELSDSINGDTISAQYSVANTINYKTACRGALSGCGATVDMQLGVDSPFVLAADFADDAPDGAGTCDDPSNLNIPTFVIPTKLAWSVVPSSFQITPVFEFDGTIPGCGISGPSTGENAYVYSTVEYLNGGKTIQYYSNKLPRVEGTLVVNPVAEVRGSVYSTGVTNPLTGKTVRSLGDVSTNILRDTIFRNVSNIIAGIAEPAGNALVSINPVDPAAGFTIDNPVAVRTLLPDSGGIPKVYYFAGDITLDEPLNNKILWTGERTLIVIGGNVYIKSDLYNPPAAGSKPKLGIIVLKDLSAPVADQAKQGHVYIAPDVKNIQANIYADGSVFSYDPANVPAINANGEPNFSGEADRYDSLLNQLSIEGSLASQNTIGGAVASPSPILGDGTTASPSEGGYAYPASGRSRARLYDLNFLRYYGLVFERHTSGACIGDAIDQQDPAACPGDVAYTIVAKTAAEDPNGDLVLNPAGLPAQGLVPATDYLSAVYIVFDPPPSTLPGFGVTTGAEVKFRPQ